MTTKSRFWRLSARDDHSKRVEWVEEEMDSETIPCPANKGHQHGGKRLTDLSVWLPNKHVEDFVWTWYSDCLIQDCVLRFLKDQQLTGFDVKPVKVQSKGKSDESTPNLWELVVTGWGGLAPRESGIELTYRCAACGHTVYSPLSNPENLIDETRWDGSDFFIVWPLPNYIFVTDRVVQSINAQAFSGVRFIASADLEPTEKFAASISPGRLSYVMPEQRAREIGEPLGIY